MHPPPPTAGDNASNNNGKAQQTANNNDEINPPKCPYVPVVVVVTILLVVAAHRRRAYSINIATELRTVLQITITAHLLFILVCMNQYNTFDIVCKFYHKNLLTSLLEYIHDKSYRLERKIQVKSPLFIANC